MGEGDTIACQMNLVVPLVHNLLTHWYLAEGLLFHDQLLLLLMAMLVRASNGTSKEVSRKTGALEPVQARHRN
jgi:hypothetical protein